LMEVIRDIFHSSVKPFNHVLLLLLQLLSHHDALSLLFFPRTRALLGCLRFLFGLLHLQHALHQVWMRRTHVSKHDTHACRVSCAVCAKRVGRTCEDLVDVVPCPC